MECPLVENCIFDIIEQHGELPFLGFGDLNTRTELLMRTNVYYQTVF